MTIKLHDKLNALVNLGKHLDCSNDRQLHGGLDGGSIQHRIELVFVEPTKRMNSN